MFDENNVAALSEGAVDPQEVVKDSSEAEEVTPEGAAAPQSEKQTPEENAKFKEFRLLKEQSEREKDEALKKNSELLGALRAAGIVTSESQEDALAEINAQSMGMSVEDYKRQQSEEQERLNALVESHPDVIAARNQKERLMELEREQIFQSDLEKIKAEYPDCKVSDLRELGAEYFKAMTVPGMDPVTAYEVQMAHNEKQKAKIPPSFGAVNSSAPAEKDYYTPEEVDRLTEEDYKKNPKLWGIVRKSMSKWR